MVTQNNFVILCHCWQDTDRMTIMIVCHCNRSRLYVKTVRVGDLSQYPIFAVFALAFLPAQCTPETLKDDAYLGTNGRREEANNLQDRVSSGYKCDCNNSAAAVAAPNIFSLCITPPSCFSSS